MALRSNLTAQVVSYVVSIYSVAICENLWLNLSFSDQHEPKNRILVKDPCASGGVSIDGNVVRRHLLDLAQGFELALYRGRSTGRARG